MSHRAPRRAEYLFEATVGRVAALAGRGTSWLRRERFPSLLSEEDAWRDIERAELLVPSSGCPDVSIILPVYGKYATTWACLESLAAVPAGAAFEVIVVDDCSPDRTAEMLRRVRGVRVVSNAQNLGFLRSNNHAAGLARGRWLCLLNNDTRTTPGWLGELVRTFDLFPSAGLVGAKLLFPDGRLQEAGAIVFKDGRASQYGRNRDPRRPELCFARRVDYCSAACALIPKSLWEQLGGFDDRYAPAYYEDTDLAFRIRRAGFEVIYQPACRIVHYEGVTHGRSLRRGPKRHQVENQQRFVERWRDVLLREQPPPGRRSWQTANRRRGPGVLVLTDVEPIARTDCYDALLAAERAGWRVSVRARRPAHDEAARDELSRRGIEVLHGPYVPPLSDLVRSSPPGRFRAVLLWNRADTGSIARLLRRRAPKLELFVAPGGASDRLDAPEARVLVFPPGSSVGAAEGRVETWRALASAADSSH